MAFLYPSFLWALAAVLVPVIIHLFNFRKYKKVYFSNVRFLRELQLESKSRSRLREILVLLMRCLAIVALVLAFARPFTPAGPGVEKSNRQTVSLYIDNSFSMDNVGRQGPNLEQARQRARELVKAVGSNGRFQVVTNSFSGNEQRFLTQDNALAVLDELKSFPAPRLFSRAWQRQKAFMQNEGAGDGMFVAFTDAQKSTFDLQDAAVDSSTDLTIIPFAANRINNVFVDSCWFKTPVRQKNFRQRLLATVKNKGETDIQAGSSRLYLDNKQVALSTFSVRAGATATLDFSFWQDREGFTSGRIEIDDYPVTFDDRLYFAYDAGLNIAVTLINGNNIAGENPFTALFSNDSVFRVSVFAEQGIDYAAFKGTDLLILNQLSQLSSGLSAELRKYAASGGCVVVVPPRVPGDYAGGLQALRLPVLGAIDSLPVTTASLDLASGFFEGVFEKMDARVNLPLVNRHYIISRGMSAATEKLISLANGHDLLVSARQGEAVHYLFTSPLLGDNSNFTRHALFVPTLYRIAMSAVPQPHLYNMLGEETVIPARPQAAGGEQPPHIIAADGSADVIPAQRVVGDRVLLYLRGQLSAPGYYYLVTKTDTLMPLAFNYDRRESELASYSAGELEETARAKNWKRVKVAPAQLALSGSALLAGSPESHMWKIFIILALVFFLAECLLLRFLK